MVRRSGAMHVARIKSSHVDKAGRRRDYQSVYLRRSFRDGGTVKHQQLANLSALPEAAISAIEAVLSGATMVAAGDAVRIESSLPHGHVAAVHTMARTLGLPALLGPPCRARDLAYGLIVSRVLRPGSKLSTLTGWADTTLGADLGITGASSDEVYAAMDWLHQRQDHIEKQLAARHLDHEVNPSRIAMFDLSSSWVTGRCCELAARGYSRDGKKGCPQIEYGLLTDPAGRPVAIRVFAGNTADPTAFRAAVTTVKDRFGLTNMVMVGDRGMITSARITALKDLGGIGWLTALRAPSIAALAADDGPLQMSLFDDHDFAEITHPDYPGERLICCRNPLLAAERARKRGELLNATEQLLAPITAAVAARRLVGADQIGLKIGKVIDKYKMAKHLHVTITDTTVTITRRHTQISAEAALDGIYVLRTSVPASDLASAAVINAYKNLANVERDFRSLKTDDLDLRPIHHRLEDRVRAHVLICMLAAYLTWHLRHALAPLTFTDENPPTRDNPVAPAQRSPQAATKAARKTTTDAQLPTHSYQGLLTHLATLTRNQVRFAGTKTPVPMLTEATDTQTRAFQLLNTTIPLSLQ
ncbi:IS1634 family transposase [Mycobacterium kansasii]|nr:IS1634 family transposase [Mycobacterium kansasii]ARG73090.1 transposase [Mycobacterium kansasii]ARG77913.1 transposase [Mycobacterium kansasii]ORC14386.1 transposase [Mycobacterium kansasii]UCA19911.1 IS1634 family transposase [Mycobacterium kansasii]UGT79970.1 IS1634 family transposase [Mycobacterium kansasii]